MNTQFSMPSETRILLNMYENGEITKEQYEEAIDRYWDKLLAEASDSAWADQIFKLDGTYSDKKRTKLKKIISKTNIKCHKKLYSYFIDSNNLAIELLPLLYVIADFSITSLNSTKKNYDRKFLTDTFWGTVKNLTPCDEIFTKRIELYASIINGKTPHFDWMMGEVPNNWNGIMSCCAALGDILFNPNRAVDYDTDTIYLRNFSDAIDFTEKIKDFILLIIEYYNKVYTFYEKLHK